MKRREAIKNTALLMGGILSTSTLSIIMEACSSPAREVQTGKAKEFTDGEKEMITQMADQIIPDTDTPGAVKAGVPEFIVMMMQDTFPKKDQNKFHRGLQSFDSWCKDQKGAYFNQLSESEQEEAVKELDELILEPTTESSENLSFYRVFKELTLLGFFTSETGATETLRYIQVPGDYKGCIPYKEGDKAWAT